MIIPTCVCVQAESAELLYAMITQHDGNKPDSFQLPNHTASSPSETQSCSGLGLRNVQPSGVVHRVWSLGGIVEVNRVYHSLNRIYLASGAILDGTWARMWSQYVC